MTTLSKEDVVRIDNELLAMIQKHFPSLPLDDRYTDWKKWLCFARAVYSHGEQAARAGLVAENERLKGIVNAELDIDSNNAGTKQQRKLDGEMEMGQLLENCEDSTTSNLKAKGKFVLKDDFNGDFDRLVASAKALLELDHSGALVPHGIGGLAVGILSSLCVRISTMNSQLTTTRTALAAADAREGKLRDALEKRSKDSYSCSVLCADLAKLLPSAADDSALREMIASIYEECAKACDVYPGAEPWEILGGAEGIELCTTLASAIRALADKAKGE